MKRGFIRSFLSGFLIGTAIGALAIWLSSSERRAGSVAWRQRASQLAQQARSQGEHIAALARERLASARGLLETRFSAGEQSASAVRSATSEVTVSTES
jgi:gas vesicle protein